MPDGTTHPHTEQFTITKRWSWLSSVTVEISCDPLASVPLKLGLAVKAAFKTDAVLTGAVLRDADLTGAVLTGAVLRDAVLTGAVLRDADLTGADLTGAVLRDADLTGADLTDAVLTGAVLRGADLTDADLTDAVLTGAVLRGAVLRGADLTDAVLTGAVLRGADLTDAVLRGRKIARLIASVNRLDGYTFYAFEMAEGDVMVNAGCQFRSVESYRQHILDDYPNTDKAKETGRILDLIEGRMEDLGIGAPKPEAPAKAKRVRKAA